MSRASLNLHQLRYSVGMVVLLGHFSAIATYLVLVEREIPAPTVFNYVDGVSALVPFTLLYAGVFYRYVVAHSVASKRATAQKIDILPFAIQFTMVLGFMAALHLSLFWAFSDLDRIEGIQNISVVLGAVDSAFAVFVSSTFAFLFPLEWEAAKSDLDRSARNP